MVALGLVVRAGILSTARRHPKLSHKPIANRVGVSHRPVARWLHRSKGRRQQVAVRKRQKECTSTLESVSLASPNHAL